MQPTLPTICCFSYETKIVVEWPPVIKHNFRIYWRTGKEGTRFRDGCPTAEYENEDHIRIWLGLDGERNVE